VTSTTIAIVILNFSLCFLGYWLGGGNFERGHDLAGIYGLSLFISGLSVIFYLTSNKGGAE
tara:strand:- start:531 stop:713 length:183 start_codon:yes stop_codon:yes gene_type:complete